jgi:hypothetical protein
MSQVAEISAPGAAAVARGSNWIIDRRTDLLFLIGPCVFGYLLLYLHVGLGLSSLLIFWFWQVSVNGAHFFATYSRTYFDRQEWRERGSLLLGSFLWIGLGPLVLIVDYVTDMDVLAQLFVLLQISWNYLHVVRQHYGVLCLYQKKNNEISGASNRIDYWLFHIAMFGPFVIWMSRYPFVHKVVADVFDWPEPPWNVHPLAIRACESVILACGAVFLAKAVVDARRTGVLNLPKILLFATFFGLHSLLYLWLPAACAFDALLIVAVMTYPHNVQYMAIVWHYNKRHYQPARGQFGVAEFINRNVPRFLILSVLFGLAFYYLLWFFGGREMPFASAMALTSEATLGGHNVARMVATLGSGVAFSHFYLDQNIWRVNRDPKVARTLGV